MRHKKNHNKDGSFPPSNVSVNYYTDPIYSSDAFYGFEDEQGGFIEGDHLSSGTGKESDVIDEPVESWGWLNNADSEWK